MFPRRYGHQGTSFRCSPLCRVLPGFELALASGDLPFDSASPHPLRRSIPFFRVLAQNACIASRAQQGSFKPSAVSTARLNGLPRLHLRPIKLVVSQRPYPVNPVGDLILGRASRLDAFSGYLCRTWLPSDAPGGTTGTPEVRPPRSSRTGGSSPQVTCAHSG